MVHLCSQHHLRAANVAESRGVASYNAETAIVAALISQDAPITHIYTLGLYMLCTLLRMLHDLRWISLTKSSEIHEML